MDHEELRRRARTLRDLAEPIGANVYFAPEAWDAYAEHGLPRPTPPADPAARRPIQGAAYFASRGACLGQAPGEVIAAAFGVFKPAVVTAAIDAAWAVTDAATLLAARQRGAVASLARIFGDDPAIAAAIPRATELLRGALDAAPPGEARALYSGLRSLGFPGTPIGDLWRACDLLREHRGDSHIIAWVGYGLTPVEASISTELWWRMPLRPYTRTRGWTDDEIETAIERFRSAGYIDGEELTAAGEAMRGEIEATTDRQERRILDALGDDADELFALLAPMTEAVVAAKGYPADPRSRTRYDQ
jgi:hypothetical protein